jgi:hypothetical protein
MMKHRKLFQQINEFLQQTNARPESLDERIDRLNNFQSQVGLDSWGGLDTLIALAILIDTPVVMISIHAHGHLERTVSSLFSIIIFNMI